MAAEIKFSISQGQTGFYDQGWREIWASVIVDFHSIYLFTTGVFVVASIIATISALLFLCVGLLFQELRQSVKLCSGIGFVAAFIAVIAGQLTGISQSGAISDIGPVLLAGLGILFAASVFHEKVNTLFAGFFAITFAATFHMGVMLGASQRARSDNTLGPMFSGQIVHPEVAVDPRQPEEDDNI